MYASTPPSTVVVQYVRRVSCVTENTIACRLYVLADPLQQIVRTITGQCRTWFFFSFTPNNYCSIHIETRFFAESDLRVYSRQAPSELLRTHRLTWRLKRILSRHHAWLSKSTTGYQTREFVIAPTTFKPLGPAEISFLASNSLFFFFFFKYIRKANGIKT